MSILKILSLCLSILFLVSCSDKSEANPNKEYVGASLKVVKAKSEFENAKYKEAYAYALEAQDIVSKILENYPDSDIALRVMTDKSTRIGASSYIAFCEEILPKLQMFADSKMQEFELAWVLSVSKNNQALVDLCLLELIAQIILADEAYLNFLNAEQMDLFINNCIVNIHSPDIRSTALNIKNQRKKVEVIAEVITEEKLPVIADKEAFLKDAEVNADLVLYDAKDSLILLEKSFLVGYADKDFRASFEKILDYATSQSKKLTDTNSKELILSRLATAYSNIGTQVKALDLIKTFTDVSNFKDALAIIAKNSKIENNFKNSISFIPYIKDSLVRDDFLGEISINMAKAKLYKSAIDLVDTIKNPDKKNQIYAQIIKEAYDNNEQDFIKLAISKIDFDLADMQYLSYISSKNIVFEEQASALAYDFVNLANILVSLDKALAESMNLKALEILNNVKSKKDFTYVFKQVIHNYANMQNGSQILKIFSENAHRINVEDTFGELIKIALELSLKDKNSSKRLFAIASNILPSIPKEQSDILLIDIAVKMRLAGLSDEDCAVILKSYLPKFNTETF